MLNSKISSRIIRAQTCTQQSQVHLKTVRLPPLLQIFDSKNCNRIPEKVPDIPSTEMHFDIMRPTSRSFLCWSNSARIEFRGGRELPISYNSRRFEISDFGNTSVNKFLLSKRVRDRSEWIWPFRVHTEFVRRSCTHSRYPPLTPSLFPSFSSAYPFHFKSKDSSETGSSPILIARSAPGTSPLNARGHLYAGLFLHIKHNPEGEKWIAKCIREGGATSTGYTRKACTKVTRALTWSP